jgi:hypothetical protein
MWCVNGTKPNFELGFMVLEFENKMATKSTSLEI